LSYSIRLNVSGGVGPYTAVSTNGIVSVAGNNVNITNIPTDSGAVIIVTGANGCQSTYIKTPFSCGECPVTASIVSSDPDNIICQGESVTLSANVSGGQMPYRYVWTPNIGSGAGPFTVSPTTTTTYTVIVTDDNGNGCSDTSELTITVNEKPNLNANASPVSICAGETSTLNFIPTTGISVLGWFNGCVPGGTSLGNGLTLPVSPLTTSTYSVIGQNVFGCLDTACVTVTVNPKPEITARTNRSTLCQGESATLSYLPVSGLTTVGWYIAAAGCVPSGNAVSTNPNIVVNPTATTTYAVVVRNTSGCLDTSCVTITVFTKPEITASASPSTICQGESTTLSFTPAAGLTVVGWYTGCTPGGTPLATSASLVVSPMATTSYSILVRTAQGCLDTACVTVNVNIKPNITALISDDSICNGESAILSFTPATGVTVVGWFRGCIPSGPALGTGATLTVTPDSRTVYSVVVQNASGCFDTSCVSLIVNPTPDISVSASEETICQGQNTTLTFTPRDGLSVLGWYNGCIPTGASIGNNTSVTVSPMATSSYSVIVGSEFGCQDTACITINVNPTYTDIVVDSTICEGSTVTIGGNSFGLTGNYQVRLQTVNGCDSIITLNLTVNPIKRTNIDAVLCFGEQITVGGQVFNTSVNNQIIIIPTSKGCDSIITLNLSILNQDTIVRNDTVCAGDLVDVGGVLFGATGTYYIPFQNNQCLGIVELNLLVNQPTASTIARTICEGELTTVGGQVYNTTGSYNITVPNAQGCDSVITLNLTVNPIQRTTIDSTICRGDSVTVGNQVFTNTGTFQVGLTSAAGCDSIVTVNLVVLTSGDTTFTAQTICAGQSATVGGQTFTQAGTYYIPSPNGICINIIAFTLNVNPVSATTLDRTICTGEAITVGGQTFTLPGTYIVTLQNSFGCDSTVTLNLNTQQGGGKIQVDTAICSGASVTFAGQTFTQTGTYQIIYPVGVCRDTLLLNLTVNPVYAQNDIIIDTTICQGDSVTIGTNSYSVSGTYVISLQTSLGCDSIVTLNLIVNPSYDDITVNRTICEGETVTIGTSMFSTSGTYQIPLQTTLGCDSIVTLNLTVNPKYTNIVVESTICEGSTVTIGNNTFGLTGNYQIRLQTVNGCDSIINLNLTVNPVKRTNIDAVLCFGEQVTVGGQVFNTSITNKIITLSSSAGCDSIITLNLTILQQDTIVRNDTICAGESVYIGGILYNTAGTYYLPFQNDQCLGVVELNLVVKQPTASVIARTICEGQLTTVGGQVFNAAGSYNITIPNAQGCDSVITLNLTVNARQSTTLDSVICRGESVAVGTQVFTVTGTYQVGLFSAAGCDSIVTLNLTVLDNGDTTRTSQTICAGGSATVGGQTFTQAGTYYIPSPNGRCTNIIEFTLNVNPLSATTLDRTICRGQAITVGNQTFTQTGTYNVTLQNALGCDSVVTLNLNVQQGGDKTQVDTAICQGGSVFFFGQTFTKTGTYQVVYPVGVCRDTLLLNLIVHPTYTNIVVDSTICEGSTVTIGNNTFGLTGNYQIRLQSVNGCDSIVTLNLTVNPIKRTNIDAVLCFGEQITVGGQVFNASVNNQIITIPGSNGCDSIITLNLTILQQDTVVRNDTICAGQLVDVGGVLFGTPGTFYIPFQNNQCLGIVELNLLVLEPTYSTIDRAICEGGLTTVGGQVFNTAGTYNITVPNAQGCDSIIRLNLTVNARQSTTLDSTICRGETVSVGTQTFTVTGTYQVGLFSAAGCDSIVTLNLTVLDNGDTTRTAQTICAGGSATVGGQTFTQAGTYYIPSPNGRCTNIIEFTLTVNPVSATTLDRTICRGEAVTVGNQTFTQTGTYNVTLQNALGCDSVVTLNLNVQQGGDKTQIDTTICEGGSVSYFGQTFTQTGTYQIIYPVGVCRDTILLNLTVNPVYSDIVIDSAICQGGSVTIGNSTFNTTGTYQIQLASGTGCDSIVTLNLTVYPSYSNIVVDSTICEGSTVTIGNNTFGVTGNYQIRLQTVNGCDSIINLNLTVNPTRRTNIDAVLCFGEQVIVGGQVFNTSVTNQIITLSSSKGCDSIITLNLTILKQDTVVRNVAICDGELVDVGGVLFGTAGTYYIPFQNNQCLGIVELNLTVKQPTASIIDRAICEGQLTTVGGQVFNTSGTYNITISNAQGCDSVITLNLTVNARQSTTIDSAICRGESVTVGTQVFTTTGTYQVGLFSAAGCDSIVTLNLTVLDNGDTTRTSQTICAGGSATVGGQTFTQAGTYYIPSPNGRCTNIIEFTLNVNPVSATSIERVICTGQAITVGNQTFTQTGTYNVTLQNSFGCDSVVTLFLNVQQGGDKTQVDTAICEGGSVSFYGQTFTQTGTYQIIYPTGVCRDTLLLNLTVHPVYTDIVVDSTICEGERVQIGNNSFGLTGTYVVTLQTVNGCDSIITLNLTVNPVKYTDVDAVICFGEQIVVGGQVFTTSVTDSVIVLSSAQGCDSILTVNISVLNQDTVVTDRTICQGEAVNIGGTLFTDAGTYYVPFQNDQCVGIIQLNLTVLEHTQSILETAICEGDILTVGGQIFTTTGSYTIIIDNSQGCDSIIKLNLSVNPKPSTTVDTAICRGESVTVGTQVFTQTGTYQVVLASSAGCDSTVTLNLTVLSNGDTTFVEQTICDGETATVGGQVFTDAGTYYIPSPNGNCINIIALTLNVKPVSSTTIDKAICQGEAFVVGNQTFTATGTYIVALQNSVGCDSIVTLNLDVSQGGVKTQLDTTICEGYSVTYAGQTFSTTGIYQIIFPSGVCRDTILLNLTVNRCLVNDTIRDTNQITTIKELCIPVDPIMTAHTTEILSACGSVQSQNNYSIVTGTTCIKIERDSTVGYNLDVLCVVTCDTVRGICDTSTVIISNTPKIDTIVTTICPTCDGDTLCTKSPVGMTITSVTIDRCKQDTSVLITVTNIPGTTCVSIIRDELYTEFVSDTVCVTKCDNVTGLCDTTVIIINIPPRIFDTPTVIVDTIRDTLIIKTNITICDFSSADSVELCDGSTAGSGNFGTWEIDSTGCLIYTAGPIKGEDTLCVRSCEINADECTEWTVIITVIGLPPVAVNDTTSTDPGVPVTIPVLGNDEQTDEDPLALCQDAIVTNPSNGSVIVNSDGTITYTPAPGYDGVDSFQYQICDPEGSDTAWVFITVEGCIIPNTFTPNGDGINDVFVIPCGEGDVQFNVYNRWGIEVYRSEGYLNDWDGMYKGSPLPEGTYYYVLKYINSREEEINKAGFISLRR
jgi:gliding motility-associated-like protein